MTYIAFLADGIETIVLHLLYMLDVHMRLLMLYLYPLYCTFPFTINNVELYNAYFSKINIDLMMQFIIMIKSQNLCYYFQQLLFFDKI